MLLKLLTLNIILTSCFTTLVALTEQQFVIEDRKDVIFTKTLNSDRRIIRVEAKVGGVQNAAAELLLSGNKTGWNILEARTNSDNYSAFNVGLCEGVITSDLTYELWYNTVRTFCDNQKEICDKIRNFIKENENWVNSMIDQHKSTSEYWWQVYLQYQQLEGFVYGYNLFGTNETKLSYDDILFLNMIGDLFDLVDKYKPKGSLPSKLFDEGHCSAIVKLLPENKDLYVAHNTWSRYNMMTRIIKKYNFRYKLLPDSPIVVSSPVITFSSYPGVLHSIDDFYTTSSSLVVQETTIGNSNNDLWKYVKPTGTVFEFIRVMVANRLGSDGKTWVKYFSQYNSGTYNNQWMVVDYKKFTPQKPPKKGLLWILEQIPGHITAKDQTSLLKKKTYWPSYNIPFYKDIFKRSGYDKLVQKYGKWFSYDGAPRAKIMKRDHKKINNMDSLMSFMRSNNYEHDPLSKCKCKPPYSASNAIAARHDLNSVNGTYPIPYLGHRPGGATDAKIINSTLIKTQQFIAVSGPTTGSNLPVFKWSKSDFVDTVPHLGQPDEWNFKPLLAVFFDLNTYN